MENPSAEKTVSFVSVKNTYKYIKNYMGRRDRSTKPRHSVDLERMFFGRHGEGDGENDDDSDTESDTDSEASSGDKKNMKIDRGIKTLSGTSPAEAETVSASESRSQSGLERGLTSSSSNTDLMARFYARLQELKETKEEDERTTATNSAAQSRNKDRRRIKTALRRLLSERLFPQEAGGKKSKTSASGPRGDPEDKDNLASGVNTPMTLGSRSKTFSTRSRQDDGELSRAATQLDTLDKVVLVREQSGVTADEDKLNGSDCQQVEKKEQVSYYRRHPLGTLKSAKISRLYRPATHSVRSHITLSQNSLQLDGLRKDRTFLQKAQTGKEHGDETRRSIPGDQSPENRLDPSKVENKQDSEAESVWRRERVGVDGTYSMSYNMSKGSQSNSDFDHPRDTLRVRHMDDLELRRLLEELYRDKKYMDKLIDTTVKDKTESEVCSKLETGRDYLLQRALFWLENGPLDLTPRPPTTDLGFKLERSRTASQMNPRQKSSIQDSKSPEVDEPRKY